MAHACCTAFPGGIIDGTFHTAVRCRHIGPGSRYVVLSPGPRLPEAWDTAAVRTDGMGLACVPVNRKSSAERPKGPIAMTKGSPREREDRGMRLLLAIALGAACSSPCSQLGREALRVSPRRGRRRSWNVARSS